MVISTRPNVRRSQVFRALRKDRVALFPEFPLRSEISFKGDDDPLGTVVGYNYETGRLNTDTGQSYNPMEVKLLKK